MRNSHFEALKIGNTILLPDKFEAFSKVSCC
jgi:hypothetical protein